MAANPEGKGSDNAAPFVQTLPPANLFMGLLNLGRSKSQGKSKGKMRKLSTKSEEEHSIPKDEPESVLQGSKTVPAANIKDDDADDRTLVGESSKSDEEDDRDKDEKANQAFYRRVQEYADNNLHHSNETDQGVFGDDEDDDGNATEVSSATAASDDIMHGNRSSADDNADQWGPRHISDEEKRQKLADVCKEFGTLEYLGKEDPEQYLWDIPAVLYTGVIIRGTFILTTQRLAFYAVVPEQTEDEEEAAKSRYPITTVGTIHFNSPTKPKLRAYLVLREDGMTAYHDSKHLHDPAGSIHFSNVIEVHNGPNVSPVKDPRFVTFYFIQRVKGKRKKLLGKMEADDVETATYWRNEIAEAWFRYNNHMDRFRLSVPLDRVEKIETFDFIGHATNYAITVNQTTSAKKNKASHTVNISALSMYDWAQEELSNRLALVRTKILGDPVSPPPVIAVTQARKSGTASWDAKDQDAHDNDQGFEPDSDESEHENEDDDGSWSPDKWLPDEDTKERFAFAFGMRPEDVMYVFSGALSRGLIAIGKIAITKNGVCFLRKSQFANRVQLIVKKEELKDAKPYHTLTMMTHGFRLMIQGHEDISFHTFGRRTRNWAVGEIKALAKSGASRPKTLSPTSSHSEEKDASSPSESLDGQVSPSAHSPSQSHKSPLENWENKHHKPLPEMHPSRMNALPKMLNVPKNRFKKVALNVCCLTIGSRGDVQPYIALCLGLQKDGHKTCIATHSEYKDWVTSYGISHQGVGGDPSVLMEISVQHKIFSRDTINNFRKWFDDLLVDSYNSVKGHDLLIESPSTFGGIHIAEALKIPYFRAFTMPWTRNGDYAQPFMASSTDLTRAYNYSSYLLFDQILWRASSAQINKWRKQTLGLPPTDQEHLHLRHVPFIYNFSEAVVQRPMDWPSWVTVSGFWFLETQKSEWEPPQELLDFIEKAKKDKKPLVYCGFGSITISDPNQLTRDVITAVEKADVRMILSKGWSGRRAGKNDTVHIPDSIHTVDSIPHDWLFDKVAAAMHHGGAGTTAASLRAGVPTLIKPFFGDQTFWAQRVHKLGAGLRVKSLSADDMADALKEAVNDRVMKEKADIVGKQLRKENGVANAIKFIYQYWDKAVEERTRGPNAHSVEKEKMEGAPMPMASPESSSNGDKNLDNDDFLKNKQSSSSETGSLGTYKTVQQAAHQPHVLVAPRKSAVDSSA